MNHRGMSDAGEAGTSMERGLGTAQPSSKDEESKIADTAIAIRNVIAKGGQEGCYQVQLIGGASFSLAVHEGDAFRATCAGENSFRGRLADAFIDLASVYARMLSAFEEFKQVQGSTFLWQPKAEALRWLLPRATQSLERSNPVFATAKERGLVDKTAELIASRDRLRQLANEVRAALDARKS